MVCEPAWEKQLQLNCFGDDIWIGWFPFLCPCDAHVNTTCFALSHPKFSCMQHKLLAAVVTEAVSFFFLYFTVLDVAESTWDDLVLGSESPVLVEFWAQWCGPCRLMHPVIEDVAKAYTGRLRCLKLNTDKNRDIATSYGIRSIPTILIFKNGERKETVIGAVTDTTLATTVERFL